jgi:hypothetical protein
MPEPCPTHDHMTPSYHAQADRLRASWQPATTPVHRWSATCLRLLSGWAMRQMECVPLSSRKCQMSSTQCGSRLMEGLIEVILGQSGKAEIA